MCRTNIWAPCIHRSSYTQHTHNVCKWYMHTINTHTQHACTRTVCIKNMFTTCVHTHNIRTIHTYIHTYAAYMHNWHTRHTQYTLRAWYTICTTSTQCLHARQTQIKWIHGMHTYATHTRTQHLYNTCSYTTNCTHRIQHITNTTCTLNMHTNTSGKRKVKHNTRTHITHARARTNTRRYAPLLAHTTIGTTHIQLARRCWRAHRTP